MNAQSLDSENRINSHWRHVRTRLYFTSASHVYSLLNVIKFCLSEKQGNDTLKNKNDNVLEEVTLRMDFLSGIYFRVFENLQVDEDDPSRFLLEVKFNHGAVINHDELD